MKRALIIMAKVPQAGKVKTRLQPALAPADCARLARAFLLDAAAKAEMLGATTIVAFDPPSEIGELKRILLTDTTTTVAAAAPHPPPPPLFVAQSGADLGARMGAAFEFAFAQNFACPVMIGTDSPTFPAEFCRRAFALLAGRAADVVLGKTSDGGFYLVGLRAFDKEIFAAVEWSSPRAFAQVAANIRRLNLRLGETPAWYDVDRADDLERLKTEFATDASAPERAPHTFRWLTTQK